MRVPGTKVLVAAAAMTVALADGAAAQAPPTYGGGRLAQAEQSKTYRPSVNLSLQPRGGNIAMLFDTSLKCGRNVTGVKGGDEIAWDGTNFSFRGAGRETLGRGRIDHTWTVTGQLSGGTATGTLRITGVRRGGGRRPDRCASRPTRAFTVKLPVAPAGGPAMPAPRAFYAARATTRSSTASSRR
jgi:hypothetical protein